MSVPLNQRTHGKLEAYTKSYELVTYTMKITSNKNIFTNELWGEKYEFTEKKNC